MAKVLLVNGSPHENGCVSAAMDEIISTLNQNGIETEKLWLGVKPMAKWIGGASAGVEPAIMGVGPAYSTEKLLKKTGLSLDDMDLIEANEAFAAQSLAVGKLLDCLALVALRLKF